MRSLSLSTSLWLVTLTLALASCTASTQLPPAVTCSAVNVSNQNGACNLVATQPCSDNGLYEIDCQDDSTCACVENGTVRASILASNMTAGYCATLQASALHDLSVKCGWNLQ